MNQSRGGMLLTLLGLLLAFAAFVVALLNWLAPFSPIGPSPFASSDSAQNTFTSTLTAESTQDNVADVTLMADTPQATAITQPSTTPTGNPTLELKAGDIRVVNRGGLEVKQVFVPAGSFMMGSEDGESGERLAQEMTLDAFWIDQTEVTNAQYAACVAEGACLLPHDNSSFTREEYYDNPAYADYPVIQIGWGQTAMFAAWAGGRLPTEAEWEYAARGPESFAYPWGNIFDGKRLNFCDVNCPLDPRDSSWDDGHADTAPVGSYVSGASWAGALDMAGNVREYVNDPYATPATRWSAPAFIGGSWGENAKNARAAYRGEFYADALGPDIGFRVVEPLSDPVP